MLIKTVSDFYIPIFEALSNKKDNLIDLYRMKSIQEIQETS